MGHIARDTASRSITSEGLSGRAVGACWAVSVILLSSGIVATFIAGTGAAPASMILFGSLFLVFGLMRRVPLSLEVGGAKFDASYIGDAAYDAGHEGGRQQGVEDAIEEVEEASQRGETPDVVIERLKRTLKVTWVQNPSENSGPTSFDTRGRAYRGPTACSAAGITYRQLDYWARTGLVEPSVRRGYQRFYSPHDIVVLRVIRRLLDAGISLQQIRFAVASLRDVAYSDLADLTLMSDGHSIYEATSREQIERALDSGRGVFGIALGVVVREVEDALSELPEASGDEPSST